VAYVPGVAHDVFVSYAHLDNVGSDGRNRGGWVDVFVDLLARQVRQRLGTREVDVWMDREHAGNMPLTPTLVGVARDSAVLLILMSPSYLKSSWCERERKAFLEVAKDRVAENRIFIANCLDVDRALVPAEIRDLIGWNFFLRDPAVGITRPLRASETDTDFVNELHALSHHLVLELTRQQQGAGRAATPAATPVTEGPRIFVARSTDDLEDRETELRNQLTQARLRVQPKRFYAQTDRGAFKAAVRQDLDGSKLFVQLLSGARGAEMPFDAETRLPVAQDALARQLGTPILRWRDRSIDPAATIDLAHRALLEHCIACPFEEFRRRVVDEARREPPPPPRRRVCATVFVDADGHDDALAQQVGSALAENGISCLKTLSAGSPEDIRKDLEGNLRDCDGVLLLYGSTEPIWVREQVRYGNKVFTQRDRRPALCIYQGPPPSKLDLGILDPDMVFLDCGKGFDPAALQPFLAKLRS
jgi:hypothetical protein